MESEIIPNSENYDANGYPHHKLHKKLNDAELHALPWPNEWGGGGCDAFSELVLYDELSRGGPGILGQLYINRHALPLKAFCSHIAFLT